MQKFQIRNKLDKKTFNFINIKAINNKKNGETGEKF